MGNSVYIREAADLLGRRRRRKEDGVLCSAIAYRLNIKSAEIGPLLDETFLLRSVNIREEGVFSHAINHLSSSSLLNDREIFAFSYEEISYEAMILRRLTPEGRLRTQLLFSRTQRQLTRALPEQNDEIKNHACDFSFTMNFPHGCGVYAQLLKDRPNDINQMSLRFSHLSTTTMQYAQPSGTTKD